MSPPPAAKSSRSTLPAIDGLPENILVNIFERLPTTEAIKTTAICPKFENLWKNLQSLTFDHRFCRRPLDFQPFIERFFHYISRVIILRNYSHPLSALHLRFLLHPDLREFASQIDSYVSYAVNHHAKTIELTFDDELIPRTTDREPDNVYTFPLFLINNSSVTFLFLSGCNIFLPRTARFEGLKSVSLISVELTDDELVDFLARCVNLEHLDLGSLKGVKNYRVNSTKIKTLTLQNVFCEEISALISAPNITELNLYRFQAGRFVMENASLLRKAVYFYEPRLDSSWCYNQILAALGHVKELFIQNAGFELYKAVLARDFVPESFCLCNLVMMELLTDFSKSKLLGMAAIFQLSPKLESLIVDSAMYYEEDTPEILDAFNNIHFRLPSLKSIRINNLSLGEDDLFLNLVVKSQVVLQKITIHAFPKYSKGIMQAQPPTILVKGAQGFQVIQKGSYQNLEKLLMYL